MLPTKLGRVANRATANSSPTNACYACLSQQRSHQRRHSSSKASSSSPADGYSGKPNTPAAKSTSSAVDAEQSASQAPAQTRSNKGKPRREYRRVQGGAQDSKKAAAATTASADATDQLAALPRVPSVQSWSEADRSLSNFFSLHRPISIGHTFPPPSTPESFSKIFSPSATSSDPWAEGNSAERKPEDVIYTLHSAIESMENAATGSQDDGLQWEVVHEIPSNTQHLDGHPRFKSLEEWVAQFKPFRAPPPPQPFPEHDTKSKSKEKKASASSSGGQRQSIKPKQKTFTTTITVTESTYANGRKTYSASSSPIVPLAEPQLASQAREDDRMTRRERMRKLRDQGAKQASGKTVPAVRVPNGARGERVRKMYLISVKRQRKLKMKKHKYKKLMRRTRNLRRKLDRN